MLLCAMPARRCAAQRVCAPCAAVSSIAALGGAVVPYVMRTTSMSDVRARAFECYARDYALARYARKISDVVIAIVTLMLQRAIDSAPYARDKRVECVILLRATIRCRY